MIGFPKFGLALHTRGVNVRLWVDQLEGGVAVAAAALCSVLQASFTPMVWTLQPMRMQDLLLEVRELTPREPNQSMDGGHTIG